MTAIIATGTYLPRLRLERAAAGRALGWLTPGLQAGRGTRAMASWDEDAITMAFEAARAAVGSSAPDLDRLYLGSTTLPFADRLNSAVVAAALGASEAIDAVDVSGSRRAGFAALRSALGRAPGGRALAIASELRPGAAGESETLRQGDAAAAFLVGEGRPIARLIGDATLTADFVDSHRAAGGVRDHRWEERWIREQGYPTLMPAVIGRLLERSGVEPGSIGQVILPTPYRGLAARMLAGLGFGPDVLGDHLEATVGDCGAALPMLLLAGALQAARPGLRILVAGFGSGADAMLFETTDAVADQPKARSLADQLEAGQAEQNYLKFLVFRGLIPSVALPPPLSTSISAAWRDRVFLAGLGGLHDPHTGETFFGPEAAFKAERRNGAFAWRRFADVRAKVLTMAADNIAATLDPPARYGLIEFEGGGRLSVDFVDAGESGVAPGDEMEMVFRLHAVEPDSGYRRYFWKARPVRAAAAT